MTGYRIIDTNVLVCASGATAHASEACRQACEDFILSCLEEGITVLDDGHRVLDEYSRYFNHSGQPTVGDQFFRRLHNFVANPDICMQVPITPNEVRGFDEFPDDPDLARFDWSDRKWVAVAIAAGRIAPIYNATDSDWAICAAPIRRHGVEVVELCPADCVPTNQSASTSIPH